jgi:LCP family protein required for cell wall assembly
MAEKKEQVKTERRNREERREQKKGGRKTAIKVIGITLCVLFVLCVGTVIYLYGQYKKISRDPLDVLVKDDEEHKTIIIDEQGNEHEYIRDDKIVNILLLGLDSSEERDEKHMGSRSDVMIVLSLDFEHKTITMMSIPRDTRVNMNKLDYETGEVKTRTVNKINAAYAFGGGPKRFGDKNAVDCVKEFLSCEGKLEINIDYYASIDLDGMPKLIDAVGGVEVVLDRDISELGKKGDKVTITSANVDTYTRKRKQDGGGVQGRDTRQQELLIAIAKKAKSQGAVNMVTKLYPQVTKYMNTNINLDEAMALASFIQGFDMENGITQYRVKVSGQMINAIYYDIPDMDDLYKFALEHFYKASDN